jgi:ubiquinone biosynthesis accessory factor UbiJ
VTARSLDPALALANRALEHEAWARDRLAVHAGKKMRVRVGPASATLEIAGDGKLVRSDAAPDLTMTISPLRVPALLARPERFGELVEAEGDPELGATLADLAITLPWWVEQTFARVLGPIAGTRVADAGRALLQLPGHAAASFGASVRDYVRDETHLAMTRAQLDAFEADVSALAEHVEALSSSVDTLSRGGGAEPGDAG